MASRFVPLSARVSGPVHRHHQEALSLGSQWPRGQHVPGRVCTPALLAHHVFRVMCFACPLPWRSNDLFVVLSGGLITGIHVPAWEEFLRRFYWRRFLRIFPPYYGVLGLMFVMLYREQRHGVGLVGAGYDAEHRPVTSYLPGRNFAR